MQLIVKHASITHTHNPDNLMISHTFLTVTPYGKLTSIRCVMIQVLQAITAMTPCNESEGACGVRTLRRTANLPFAMSRG